MRVSASQYKNEMDRKQCLSATQSELCYTLL